MNNNREEGKEIIKTLGVNPYILWLFLLERDFESLSIKELEQHFGRNQRTIRGWIKKLKENGYIKESA